MASAKFEKGSKEFSWFGDFWQIVQKHWIPEAQDDAYWESLVTDINKLYEKYKSDEKMEHFCKRMAVAYLKFLEEENKNVR